MISDGDMKGELPDKILPDLTRDCLIFRVRFLAIAFDAAHCESAPIGDKHMMKLHTRRAGSRRVPGDGHFVPGPHDVFAKTRSGQLVRIAQLRAPMHDVALIIGNIEKDAAMRVGPNPFGHGSLQSDPFVLFIRHARSMVREQ